MRILHASYLPVTNCIPRPRHRPGLDVPDELMTPMIQEVYLQAEPRSGPGMYLQAQTRARYVLTSPARGSSGSVFTSPAAT
jgi:hypothetical protein